MSTYAADYRAATKVEQFLDENFYPRLHMETERVYDKERQVRGMDVLLAGGRVVIDEKAQISCANRPRDTFIMELGFYDRAGRWCDGWFLRDDLATTHYLLVWLDEVAGDIYKRDSVIRKVSLSLISKAQIKSFLSDYVDSYERLVDEVKRSRCGRIPLGDGLRVVQSVRLSEAPVNVVIPRQKLHSWAIFNGAIAA